MREKLLILFVALTCSNVSGWYDSSDEEDLASLRGLGDRIRAEVAESLRPMHIQLRQQREELAGLGDRISQQVYDSLEPVRALELNMKMKNGVGGVTVATVQPSGREFLIKNYRRYTCSTKLDQTRGTCSGQLTQFTITKSSPKTEWCYVNNYSQVNNRVCLSYNGAVSIEAFNNQVNCFTNDGSPVLNIAIEDYKKLCSEVRKSTEYRYVPDLNDKNHVEIPNENKHVKCENQDKDLCIFREDNSVLSFYGGSVIINNVA
ncbi:uncharacterized protein LOC126750470 [Anthonomus grandis grandis]|uniref:uncharacterized protein LOC126750470 n=1 Tax=Anthonomus grandis grandis TaxID=2921223 RepID=UPI002166753E|nr:uncharacterized protein LOC126750470 [Anthonomus grandis grandis]